MVNIALGADLHVQGTVTNDGKIQETFNNTTQEFVNITNSSGAVKYRGVMITASDWGQTTVAVWGNQTCATAVGATSGGTIGDINKSVLRCYEITKSSGNANADLVFYYLDSEKQDNKEPFVHHWDEKWTGAVTKWDRHWDPGRTYDLLANRGKVESAGYLTSKAVGVQYFSPFALRDIGPSAVSLRSLSART